MLCEKRWYFNYVEELVPYGPDWLHFAKGSYLHELLHYYYSLVESGYPVGDDTLIKAVIARVKEDLEEADNPDLEFYQMCMRTIIAYMEQRSPVIDQKISKLSIESHLQVEYDGRKIHGYTDLIYYDNETKRWVVRDHKTGNRNVYDQRAVFGNGQLLFYGTLLYLTEGIVPDLEINWINSTPPKNPKQTQLFATYRVSHTEETYKQFWEYLQETHNRQKNTPPLRNLMSCGKCPYHPICSSELRGLSTDLIKQSRYGQKDTVQTEDTTNVTESD